MNTSRTPRIVASLMVAGAILVSAGCSEGGGTTVAASAEVDASQPPEAETNFYDLNRQRILADITDSADDTLSLEFTEDEMWVVHRGGRPDVMAVIGVAGEIVGYGIANDLNTSDPVATYNNCVAAAGADAPPCKELALAKESDSSRVWLGNETVRALPLFSIDGDPSDPTAYMTVVGAVSVETSRSPDALAALESCAKQVSAQPGEDAINRACAPAKAYRM